MALANRKPTVEFISHLFVSSDFTHCLYFISLPFSFYCLYFDHIVSRGFLSAALNPFQNKAENKCLHFTNEDRDPEAELPQIKQLVRYLHPLLKPCLEKRIVILLRLQNYVRDTGQHCVLSSTPSTSVKISLFNFAR